MEMDVLVYDNQVGYYEFLKNTIQVGGFNFVKFDERKNSSGYDAIVFFMQNKFELMDFVKIYRDDLPVIFCSSTRSNAIEKNYNSYTSNIRFLDLAMPKEQMSHSLLSTFSEFGKLVH